MKKIKDLILCLIIIILCNLFVFKDFSYAESIEWKSIIKVSETTTIDDTIQGAKDFISEADTTGTIDETSLKNNIDYIYNIFFACGMVVAVACGAYLGIRFMCSSVEGKSEIKELLIPYVVGCVIIFGAFGIWKIVIIIMERFN